MNVENLILGAGISGLSSSYHIGHDKCLILEGKTHPYGHIHSEVVNGFTWDEGPHVSFTNSEYVRELFEESVQGKLEEYEVTTGNYFHGHWIDHPAQSNLYQIPEPLRTQCLQSFMDSRTEAEKSGQPENYREWLHQAFGKKFAETFPEAYTRKYWTVDPKDLTTDWVGKRVFKPSVEDVRNGAKGPLDRETHYIKKVRYPTFGGYKSFAETMLLGANIQLGCTVTRIDLRQKCVYTNTGKRYTYKRLVNTIALPVFIQLCEGFSKQAEEAVNALMCSRILLVNLTAPHEASRKENWLYVYDEDKYSTRINFTEKLSPNNAPAGQTGVQVEVYHSSAKPLNEKSDVIAEKVMTEMIEMGLIDPDKAKGRENIKKHLSSVLWANVIFHHETKSALDQVFKSLETFGLMREDDDTNPLTKWENKAPNRFGDLVLAGRFGQWKYYWTDDCVLRGRHISKNI